MVFSKIFKSDWFSLIPIYWIKIALVSFICFNALHLFSQQRLTITDCYSGEPISDVIITRDIKKSPLAYTNHKGVAEWKRSEERTVLNFKKLGSLDTNVMISPRQTTLCLHQKVNELERVEIEGKTIPLHKQFEQFIQKTVSVLPTEDDSLYYSFSYTLEVPDSGWICHFSGEIIVPANSYRKRNSGACGGEYCKLHIKVNPKFYHSDWIGLQS